jgi:cell division protein ZapA (FtsZ GTPase activity inhibitor)
MMNGFQNKKTQDAMDQFFTIELFGQPYTFKTEATAFSAKEVADFFVEEVSKVEGQISEKSSNMTKQAILIVTALNIVSENFELKRNHSDLLSQLSEKTTKINHLLDARR